MKVLGSIPRFGSMSVVAQSLGMGMQLAPVPIVAVHWEGAVEFESHTMDTPSDGMAEW